jgi:hypothetical protein
MTRATLCQPGSRTHALLTALLAGPGTYYQICERAGFDIEDNRTDYALRKIFDHMIGGAVRLVGITYHLTDEARLALGEKSAAPLVGQVAGPAYRGTAYVAPVRIARCAAGARA